MKLCHVAVGLSATCAFFLFANPARAADARDCKPLKLLNSIKMTTNSDRSRFYVPVVINGTPKNLLLDTGGGMTQISQHAAKELKLEDTYTRLVSHDLYGHVSDRAVRTATFDLGSQRGENMKFQIDPTPELPDDAAGVLSTDLFLQYDIDLDFGAERLNYFSQDHCEGRVAYWPERPLAVLPVELSGGHLNLDVTLDGKVFHAILDTGAPVTTAGPLVERDKGNNFERLSFGDITVLHPQINIMPEVFVGAPPTQFQNDHHRHQCAEAIAHLHLVWRKKALHHPRWKW